ncbi:hypothetical protein GCM10010260_12660 [Streptomyces filipinensis]|uniref:DUF1266 domain-containing protein n=1 Tax=Streptomyces filipinensis TaxID=66887 RepID=A0A918I6I7_9ACTN|nr:DUF1266 domain-containing protein [Streptomyces filipinensis]GGU81673.1 hypothetical protein GCM10010260_12660 [Streptomyces filipinensis]
MDAGDLVFGGRKRADRREQGGAEGQSAERYVVGELDDHDEALPDVPTPAEPGTWQAPAALEQHLYELLTRHAAADWQDPEAEEEARGDLQLAYLEALAGDLVYVPFRREETSPDPGRRTFHVYDTRVGRIVAVYTRGLLPRPHPYLVFEAYTLRELADDMPDDVAGIAVNNQTPCPMLMSADAEERQVWRALHNEHWDEDGRAERLVTLRTGAPPRGPLLHGLALGAHMCFVNGEAWNNPHYHGLGLSMEHERLAKWWDVTDRAAWQEIQRRLLERDVTPWYWEFVLDARNALAHRHPAGRPQAVDPTAWRERVELTLRERAAHAPEGEIGPDWEEFVAHVVGLVGKVLRYEARFRADGLLPADAAVRSVAAWDLGRASMMARWGYGARFATRAEMREAVVEASEAAQAAHTSWHDFSAGYALGRCLHFDDEEFGGWYQEMLAAHRALAGHPDSPWNTVPFHVSRGTGLGG